MTKQSKQDAVVDGHTQHINVLTATLHPLPLTQRLQTMNENMQKKNPIASLDVIGGFNMIAFYDDNERFTHVACSCGWEWNGFPDKMLEVATFHNATHKNFMQIEKAYVNGEYSFEAALNFATMLGMPEQRADEWLDNMRNKFPRVLL